jgi:hypothetical protein
MESKKYKESKKYNTYQKNPKQKYEGAHYAITGKGGFSIKDSYVMKITPIQEFGKYDMTNAVQILFPASLLNSFLGGFNEITKKFNKDLITVTSQQLLKIDKKDILSVGAFDSMYYDYQKHINTFFRFSMNNSSLFTTESQTEINNGIFDEGRLYSMLNEKSICPFSGEITDALNGYIEIKNITDMLSKINDLNLFGNRFSHDISKGFMNGDLIHVSNGMNIKLNVDMSIDSAVVSILENKFMKNSGISDIGLVRKYQSDILLRLV